MDYGWRYLVQIIFGFHALNNSPGIDGLDAMRLTFGTKVHGTKTKIRRGNKVVEKNKESEAVWWSGALQGVLKEVHSLFTMFHGSVRALLEKQPDGGLARSHLYSFIMDYLNGRTSLLLMQVDVNKLNGELLGMEARASINAYCLDIGRKETIRLNFKETSH